MHATPNRIDALYRQHHAAVLARLRRRFPPRMRETCEDALQQAWITLDRKERARPGYVHPETVARWLYVVARNEAYQLDQVQQHELPAYDGDDALAMLPAAFQTDREALARLEFRDLLDLLTGGQLSLPRRQALAARIVGLSYAEVGATYGRTYTAVNRHTRDGRDQARKVLA